MSPARARRSFARTQGEGQGRAGEDRGRGKGTEGVGSGGVVEARFRFFGMSGFVVSGPEFWSLGLEGIGRIRSNSRAVRCKTGEGGGSMFAISITCYLHYVV